ncbi:kielin/chordin-like protein [Spodoptera litura]|uniref:Kielin/chordin-like protein n=1 Tax=Spodoptera litura TaxID=69820 RepID=A0A9J7IQS3_SPOLT|nr:kielin/chordin-like protein [Spodoptera litura]
MEPKLERVPHCVPGQPVRSPDKCNSCICYEGEIFCTNLPCPAPNCTNGETIPNPDPCNKCMCDNNKVACSDLICIPAPQCIEKKSYPPQNKCNVCMCLKGHIMCTTNNCTIEKNETFAINETIVDDSGEDVLAAPLRASASVKHFTTGDRTGSECDVNQPVYKTDGCNECYCFEGRLVCSDVMCMRGPKCVEGQEIPKPDSCNSCRCIEGHILCTNHECPDTISKNSFGTDLHSSLEPGLNVAYGKRKHPDCELTQAISALSMELKKAILDLRSDMNNQFFNVNTCINDLREDLNALSATSSQIQNEVKELRGEYSRMRRDISDLHKCDRRLKELESRAGDSEDIAKKIFEGRFDAFEQQARQCNIEIANLPEKRG